MREQEKTADSNLSAEHAQTLEGICEAFNAALRAGQSPRIEEVLGNAPPPLRPALVRELVVLEIAYQTRSGATIDQRGYRSRFPELATDLERLARRAQGAAGSSPGPRVAPIGAPGAPRNRWPAIPGYEVLEEVDRGGMGIVYKARQIRLERIVALKMIRAGEQASAETLARFRVEAEAVARLEHPHVVRIYDFGEWEGQPYFSMEYVEKGSLTMRLRNSALSEGEDAELLETLARTMQYVHEHNIIHRDLKPANILLAAGGAPKIADFGLARDLDQERSLSISGMILGTPGYMAPELAKGSSQRASPATDVYSLGAILYELLTGRPPFRGETWLATLDMVRYDKPIPPSRLVTKLSRALEAICLQCLEKDPTRRYASALELADDVRRFLNGEASLAQANQVHESWAEPAGFEILAELGRGDQGVNYKARQIAQDRLVYLKVLPIGSPANLVSRLRVEADVMRRLEHPNIVALYGSGQQDGHHYLAQEWVGYTTLDEKLAGVPQEPRSAAALIATLARAIHYAHENGILHQALQPTYVVLSEDGVPKITNFGMTRRAHELEQVQTLHQTAAPRANVLETVRYMAPEQIAGNFSEIGPATDVYSLGTILYSALTGQPPFKQANPWEVFLYIHKREPEPPSRTRPEVPGDLDAICLRCLRKAPQERYASASALAGDLDCFLNEKPLGQHEAAQPERPAPESYLKRVLKRKKR